MKDTGIIRKIDDLGRIVIPKEIRKKLKLREGDNLEIYVKDDGQILLKKYEPMGDLIDISNQCTKALNSITNLTCIITDTENVISVCGTTNKIKYFDRAISNDVLDILDSRAVYNSKSGGVLEILESDENKSKYKMQIIIPIISDGEALGSVILVSFDSNLKIGELEEKIAKVISMFISNHFTY